MGNVWLGEVVTRDHGYQNDWDDKVDFTVPTDTILCGLHSTHHNHHEDRRWKFTSCYRDIGETWEDAYTTGDCNDYDKEGSCTCQTDYAMIGLYSTHNNHHEDRKWRIRCAKMPQFTWMADSCKWSGYHNDYDQTFTADYKTKIMAGMSSVHSNNKEDRKFKFYNCDIHWTKPVRPCASVKMTDMTITSDPNDGVIDDMMIIKTTVKLCDSPPDEDPLPLTVTWTENESYTKDNSYEYSKASDTFTEHTFEASLEVSATAGASFKVADASTTVTASVSNSNAWSETQSKSSTSYFGTSEEKGFDLEITKEELPKPGYVNEYRRIRIKKKATVHWRATSTCYDSDDEYVTHETVTGRFTGAALTDETFETRYEKCSEPCVDLVDNCSDYLGYCQDPTWMYWLQDNCLYSCGHCTPKNGEQANPDPNTPTSAAVVPLDGYGTMNLVQNGDFEHGAETVVDIGEFPTHWGRYGTFGSTGHLTGISRSGKRGVLFYGDGLQLITTTFKVQEGKKYKLSFWANGQRVGNQIINRLETMTGMPLELAEGQWDRAHLTTTSNRWQHFEHDFTPKNTEDVKLVLGTEHLDGDLNLDDVWIGKKAVCHMEFDEGPNGENYCEWTVENGRAALPGSDDTLEKCKEFCLGRDECGYLSMYTGCHTFKACDPGVVWKKGNHVMQRFKKKCIAEG